LPSRLRFDAARQSLRRQCFAPYGAAPGLRAGGPAARAGALRRAAPPWGASQPQTGRPHEPARTPPLPTVGVGREGSRGWTAAP